MPGESGEIDGDAGVRDPKEGIINARAELIDNIPLFIVYKSQQTIGTKYLLQKKEKK